MGSLNAARFDFTRFKVSIVAGGDAGDHTLTGIEAGDQLVAVTHLQGDGSSLTGAEDLTAEFIITGDDTINNAEGTATTNGFLQVFWIDKTT